MRTLIEITASPYVADRNPATSDDTNTNTSQSGSIDVANGEIFLHGEGGTSVFYANKSPDVSRLSLKLQVKKKLK